MSPVLNRLFIFLSFSIIVRTVYQIFKCVSSKKYFRNRFRIFTVGKWGMVPPRLLPVRDLAIFAEGVDVVVPCLSSHWKIGTTDMIIFSLCLKDARGVTFYESRDCLIPRNNCFKILSHWSRPSNLSHRRHILYQQRQRQLRFPHSLDPY